MLLGSGLASLGSGSLLIARLVQAWHFYPPPTPGASSMRLKASAPQSPGRGTSWGRLDPLGNSFINLCLTKISFQAFLIFLTPSPASWPAKKLVPHIPEAELRENQFRSQSVFSTENSSYYVLLRGACWDASVVRIRGSEGPGSSEHRLGRSHHACCLGQRARELFPLPSPQLLFRQLISQGNNSRDCLCPAVFGVTGSRWI